MNDISHSTVWHGRPGIALDLSRSLKTRIGGEVRFDDGSRALYATDASNYRQLPIGVVVPRSIEDVTATVAICRQFDVPLLARGGGTSLAGQCCNVAVVMDMSKYLNRVIAIDAPARQARVQPGCVLDTLRNAAEHYRLTFGPDPSTHDHNTLGGMIGNDSCGSHSVMAVKEGRGARTSDNVESLEVLTYDGLRMRVGATSEDEITHIISSGGRRGEIYRRLKSLRDRYADLIRARFPKIPRRVSGYNLDELLPEKGFNVARAVAGSEGTCITILEATVALIPSPPARVLLVLGYPDIYSAADHVPEIMAHRPTALEAIDEGLVDDMEKKNLNVRDLKLLPEGKGWLLVEFGAETRAHAHEEARGAMAALRNQLSPPSMMLYERPEDERRIALVRESGLGATALVPGADLTWEGWEDSAVPPEKLGGYLRDFRALLNRYGYRGDLYGHFGQGCLHVRIDFDLMSAEGVARYRAFAGDAADLVVRYGGSLSGEHGDGQSRAELLPKMFGPELVEAFREFKSIWDPAGRMNPGKVVDPYRIDENLRLGPSYREPRVATYFKFPEDRGSFGRAALRCVGVGKCRRTEGGTMCPSYRATREEMHSTRGRARLLFEMLQGEGVDGAWRDDNVRDALDLCLACKGCKGECPLNVDMATYRAEFMAHYYEGRLRPREAYMLGLIREWSALGSLTPGIANLVTQTPGLRSAAKRLAGIAPQRTVPAFAPRTFRRQFTARAARKGHNGTVILWPDTFTNHFYPETGLSAVEVLEAAGYAVKLPPDGLCCGLPLFYYGMLGRARERLRKVLDALAPEIASGTPMIGLEPSCTTVFRDELTNLFPTDALARRLRSQTFLFSEFLAKNGAGLPLPKIQRKAMVHGHCHHKAVLGMEAEEEMLKRMELDCETLDSGCCGMAGAFGFERAHYDVSRNIGELALLPRVRAAADDTIIIADGFSCREQIAQETNRRALHIADVMHLALRGELQATPEASWVARREENQARMRTRVGARALVLAGGAIAAGAWLWNRHARRMGISHG